MSVIEEIKQRIDIVEVISQYVSLTKAGRTFRGLCPFHSEKHPSFFVYPEQQSWHCFGACNMGGDVFSFIMRKEGIDFGEALRLLAQRAGVSLPTKFEPSARKDEQEKLYQANEAAAQYFHNLLLNSPAGEKARNYVASRGFSLKTITSFQLGFSLNSWEALQQDLTDTGYTKDELTTAGLIIEGESGETHDRFRNRLMFPIYDIRGHITGFGARALDDSLPKYLNSPQTPVFDKSSSLYGINLATPAIRQQNIAIIVEGYMDVITAHQNGFNNVVAAMGTSVTEKQVSAIKRLTRNMVLALDADTAGEEAMLRGLVHQNELEAEDFLLKALHDEDIIDREIKIIVLPSGIDPDNVIRENAQAWQDLVEKALPVIDYTFNMITSSLDLTTAKDKSLAVDRLLPIITEIKDPVRQAHYLQKLARLVSVTERSLEAALKGIRPGQSRRHGTEPKQKAPVQALRPLLSSPAEEPCLALLLQHPELKEYSQSPLPEYFENSENREIFTIWQQVSDLSSLKDKLDTAIHDHLNSLINKSLPANQIEPRYASYILRLREDFLRRLTTKREAALALEAELGGTTAELAKLEEQGIEISTQLSEVFTQKGTRAGAKEVRNEPRQR